MQNVYPRISIFYKNRNFEPLDVPNYELTILTSGRGRVEIRKRSHKCLWLIVKQHPRFNPT